MSSSPGSMFFNCAGVGAGIPPEDRDARDAAPPPPAEKAPSPDPDEARPGVRGASPLSKPEGDDGADARDSLAERASAEESGPDNRAPSARSAVPPSARLCGDTRGCVLPSSRISAPEAPYASAAPSTSSGENMRGREERDFIGLIVLGAGFSPGKPRLRGRSVCATPPSLESQDGAMRTKFAPFTPSAGLSAMLGRDGHSARSSARRDRRASPAVISRAVALPPRCQSIQRFFLPRRVRRRAPWDRRASPFARAAVCRCRRAEHEAAGCASATSKPRRAARGF